MRILITTGLSPADVGGPAQYAHNLAMEFNAKGHTSNIASYGSIERVLPIGIRHLYFFLKILPRVFWSDGVIALDTFSVGVPSVLGARFLRKKITIRVGGDFLWSAYVNRTDEPLTLPVFYLNMPILNPKEKIILLFTKILISRADFLAFNTEWQRNIWCSFYKIKEGKSRVVRNFIPDRSEGGISTKRNFLWAGRLIPEKNIKMLKKFNVDMVTGEPHGRVLEKLKECYAAISLAYSDICPNFIIEAVSFGKPFIMTKETGLNEIFPKGGLFVDPLNQAEITKALEKMLDDNTHNKYVEELKDAGIRHPWNELAEEFLEIWKRP